MTSGASIYIQQALGQQSSFLKGQVSSGFPFQFGNTGSLSALLKPLVPATSDVLLCLQHIFPMALFFETDRLHPILHLTTILFCIHPSLLCFSLSPSPITLRPMARQPRGVDGITSLSFHRDDADGEKPLQYIFEQKQRMYLPGQSSTCCWAVKTLQANFLQGRATFRAQILEGGSC